MTFYLERFRSAEVMRAVSGIASIIPMLLAIPLIISVEKYAEVSSWKGERLRELRYMMSVNPEPRKARIRVLVIVPTISRPMFIPERNRSLKV